MALLLAIALVACGDSNPYIGENGNWWVEGEDTGVSAKGPSGESITVSAVNKTSSLNNIDTYTIVFSDGSTASFDVINGKDGTGVRVSSVQKTAESGSVDTYTITFSDGTKTTFTVTNGKDGAAGKTVYITSISKTATSGLTDTYTITFSDGTKKTFKVTNGKDGQTPYIGDNGNWWIGDEDTGVVADFSADNRIITDGLTFIVTTAGGVAGMVVDSYNGTDSVVNIPNYVGSVPVIGITENAFRDNTKITAISLSKNTTWLYDYVFEGCSSLTSIDFNGSPLKNIPSYAFQGTKITELDLPSTLTTLEPYAFYKAEYLSKVNFNDAKITEIPNYAFSETSITEIALPDTVTKLGDSAFGLLKEINYENITHFGDESMELYAGGYVYLTKDVEYVGDSAFRSSYVFIEHESIPSNWGSNIAGNYELNETVITGAQKNASYIYKKNTASVTVHRYIGEETKISIPSKIDGLNVTKIGYGFCSLTDNQVEILEALGIVTNAPSTWGDLVILEEVAIPSSVTIIDYGTFVSFGTMIFVPSSVNSMWIWDENDAFSNYFAFESTSYPTFKSGWVDSSSSVSSIHSYVRHGLGINKSKAYYSSTTKSYFYKETSGYSYLACMDITAKSLTIPSTYSTGKVYTIRPHAVFGLPELKTVIIKNGITKIQGYAFKYVDLDLAVIPSSVVTINAYGFNNCCDEYFCDASEKPAEWDSYWAGSSSSATIHYGKNSSEMAISNDILYYTKSSASTLVRYLGNSNMIIIPASIGGLPVTTIENGFYESSSYATIYIPSTVSKIEERAFYFSSNNYSVIWCGKTAPPSGYAEGWYYSSYSSNYITVTYGVNLPATIKQYDNFLYTESDDEVILLNYIGNSGSLKIPRTIEGKLITTINSGFYQTATASTKYIYIPKTITTIKDKAFINMHSYTMYIYCEATSIPSTWASNFYYSNYSGNTTSYKSVQTGYSLSY